MLDVLSILIDDKILCNIELLDFIDFHYKDISDINRYLIIHKFDVNNYSYLVKQLRIIKTFEETYENIEEEEENKIKFFKSAYCKGMTQELKDIYSENFNGIILIQYKLFCMKIKNHDTQLINDVSLYFNNLILKKYIIMKNNDDKYCIIIIVN